jgi:uncharacterized protein (TIGR03067 family)
MLALSLLIVAGSIAAPAPPDAAKKAQEELQGTWVAVGMEEKGEKVPAKDLKDEDISVSIKGNELTMMHRGKADRYTFTLDPGKKPAHMDLQESGDKARPGTCHAIYSVEKGELKICVSSSFNPNESEERPKEFATGSGSESRPPKGMKGKYLFIFKQDKKQGLRG